jgi:electron transfer flavoprotein alpha subunit
MILVFAERSDDELYRQALAFANSLEGGNQVHAVGIDDPAGYSPDGWATALARIADERGPTVVVGPGTERGNEVLAHVAAMLDLPMAANCIAATLGDPLTLTRVRWGGSLLEEARLHGTPALLTVAPHAVAADPAAGTEIELVEAPPTASVRVSEHTAAVTAGVSLADADVVVSGGRGVGSAEGFSVIEELAQLLGAAVGCSRAVTSAGWRPHTDQVGQTGTKISPSLYIACGISGATQHMAGCKGAKKLMAINPDREASIFASADYAVFGDLHEVVPAISAEIRKVRGG